MAPAVAAVAPVGGGGRGRNNDDDDEEEEEEEDATCRLAVIPQPNEDRRDGAWCAVWIDEFWG